MAYFTGPTPVSGIPGEVHSTKQNDLGTIARASDGCDYIYLQGVANTVAGDWVNFKQGVWTTARLTTTMRGGVAIATAAVVASNYGWYGYVGSFTSNCLSATLSNGYLYATATAGSAEDLLTKNEQIKNATATGAPVTSTGGGSQVVSINKPWVGSYDESA
jgi:hypothetical protein